MEGELDQVVGWGMELVLVVGVVEWKLIETMVEVLAGLPLYGGEYRKRAKKTFPSKLSIANSTIGN